MQVAEITRSETSKRAQLLRVESYDIQLDLTAGEKLFRSQSVITFDCTSPGAATYLDLVAQSVLQITLNGAPVDPAAAYADGRIALAGLAARNEVRVVADCAYTSDGSGMHRAVDSADGRVYLYTNFEPADARKVYANFEQPDLKAAFIFHVTAPAHWTVLSNQPAPGPEPAAEGAAVWHFPATPRISTYLTAVVAGEYHLVRDSHTTAGGQRIPLGLACRQSLAEHLETGDVLGITRQGLDYFTALFGRPYPFAKYDQVYVPEFSAGAMENVGCVVITESSLFRSRVTDAAYEDRARRILHEMAHMWFGDLVTMRWWDDLWLNESFAEFCAALACAEATRFSDAWTSFCGGRKAGGYAQDQQPSTHPVAAQVPTLSEAIANFDGISYAKGASVLKQLAAYVGREQFFAGIRAYLAEHAWGNATLADLLRALEESSGADLGGWATAWLQTAGPNTLRADFTVGTDGTFTEFAVLQEAAAQHPTLRPHHIAIGLYSRRGDAIIRTHRVEADVYGARTVVPELAGLGQPDLILLNDDDLGYAVVRLDPRSLRTVCESVGEVADPLARAVCWSTVTDMARQAEISLAALVRAVAAGMGPESSLSVLQTVLRMTTRMLSRTADPQWLPAAREQLAAAALGLLRAAEPGSDRQLAWAQLLGATAVTGEQLGLLAGLLKGSGEIPGLTVDAELRWALLGRLAATGKAAGADIDAELERDATDAGRRHAAACRAAIPDAAHKAAAWRLLTESDELGVPGVVAVSEGFWQADHAQLLAPYADSYFELLPQIWASRGEQFRVLLATTLFPVTAAGPELLERIEAFLAGGDRHPGLVRVLVEGRDVVEKALRSRALPA